MVSMDFLPEVFGPLSYHSDGNRMSDGVIEDTLRFMNYNRRWMPQSLQEPGLSFAKCRKRTSVAWSPGPNFPIRFQGGLARFPQFSKFLCKQLVEDALQKGAGCLFLVRLETF